MGIVSLLIFTVIGAWVINFLLELVEYVAFCRLLVDDGPRTLIARAAGVRTWFLLCCLALPLNIHRAVLFDLEQTYQGTAKRAYLD